MKVEEIIKQARSLQAEIERTEKSISVAKSAIDNSKGEISLRLIGDNRESFSVINPEILIVSLKNQLDEYKEKLSPIEQKLHAIELMLNS
ncbi:hypothetical protein VCSRO111_0617 [Vibrio cholerae]|uniref:hypothetical protein n=1 Tax=Vibrio cholerae TaxID=666 RepID=UPI0011D635C6|nr:hypothetical protein [Vibrio cholerae]TXY57647.1 hypothetical protein FXE91_10845 [Vibrio cholerae]GHX89576.1 hypothetical protein VCSRO111_0617 [Vibrio cholerae]